MPIPQIIADFTTQLTTAIGVGGTAVSINLNVDDDGNTLPDGFYFFTVDGDTSSKEYWSCTKTGTALSNIASISRQAGSVSGSARAHRVGALVVMTDFATYKSYIDQVALQGVPNASNTLIGATKLTVAPANGANPLAVGDNDPRVPTLTQAQALAGTGTPSSSNKFVTADTLSGDGGTDVSQTTENTALAVGEANATTKHEFVAQSFVPSLSSIQGVRFYKAADTGSFTGTLKVSIQADNAGSPSGSDLTSFTFTNTLWLSLNAAANIAFSFATEYAALIPGNTYWLVFTPSTSDTSNHPNLGYDNTSAHSAVLKFNNSTDGWTTIATSALTFQTLSGRLSKLLKTDTNGNVPIMSSRASFVQSSTDAFSSASNTVTETIVWLSKNIDGGLFTPNSSIKVKLGIVTNSGNASTNSFTTAKLKYNGATIASVQLLNASSSTGHVNTWYSSLEFVITNQAAVNSQATDWREIDVGTSLISGTPVGPFAANSIGKTTSSVDLSQPGIFSVTLTNGTATNFICNFSDIIIEKIG